MAYTFQDAEDQEEPTTSDEMFESVRGYLSDLDVRLKKIAEGSDDAAAGIRLELAHFRREIAETRVAMSRLQNRFDNQLMTLVFTNVASSLCAVGLILGISHSL